MIEAVVQRCSNKGVLRNIAKCTEKHLCQGLFLSEAAGFKPAILSTKGLWHRFFPVNLPFFIKHLGYLLLK